MPRNILPIVATLIAAIHDTKKPPRYRLIWKDCQWDSADGEESEAFEMFRIHGTPAEIQIEAQ